MYVAKWLAEKFDIILKGKCNICEAMVDLVEIETVNPKHFGGIAYSDNEKICEECYSLHCCGYCGEYWDDNETFDEEGFCEYCQKRDSQ